MALRAFWRRGREDGTNFGGKKPLDSRVRRAAGYVAEALEGRRLLAGMTPGQIAYSWDHMPATLRHELAVYEYVYPEFQVRLNAALAEYGLEPVAPEAGTLGGDGRSRFHGLPKVHRIHKPHVGRGHQPKPVRHHGKDAGAGPSVTDFEFYDQTKPNTLTFRFDQAIDWTNAGQALTVIDLNSGATVSTTGVQYSAALHSLTYSIVDMDSNSPTPLLSGDYAVFLDGSLITAEGNPNAKMLGTDKVAGDGYVDDFMFQVADANGDGMVSLSDFAVLSQNFGLSGATYSQGDFNYDGQVSLGDFGELTKNFGGSVQPLAGPGTLTATAVDQSRIRLDWGASAEERVNGYDVYRDDVKIGTTAQTTYTDQPAGGTGRRHGYFVVAKDPDGRASKVEAVVMAQTAPTVSGELSYQSLPQQLVFTFNQPVTAAWDSALVVIDLKTGSAVAHASGTYGATSPPTVTYDLSAPLADGNYEALLKGSQIGNADGTPLVGSDGVAGHDYVKDFYFLNGDLTLDDRTVSQSDVDTVSNHRGSVGGYSYGDVNYSGGVDQADVDFITGAAGRTLPLLAAPGTPAVSSTNITHDAVAQIVVTWGASATTGAVYDLYRDYVQVATGRLETSFTDVDLAAGSTHVYFVVARDASTQDTSYMSGELVATAAVVPPLAPTGFIPVEVTANSVLLAWSDDDPAVTGYNVYRSDLQHAEVLVASNVAGTAYYDAGLTEGTNYTYRVEAVTASGASGVSSTCSVSTPAAGSLPAGYGVGRPSTPGGVTASDTSSSVTDPPRHTIHVSWSPSSGSGPIVYEIDRDGVAVGGTTSTTFDDNTVSAGVTYTYRVVAYDAAYNKSDASAPANGEAAGDVEKPGAPLDLQVTGVTSTSVTLSWLKPADDIGVDHYVVTRNPGLNQTQLPPVAGTTITDSGLIPGASYTYRVDAVDVSQKQTQADFAHPSAQTTTTTLQATWSPTDNSAPNQYIPPEWRADFYDNLTGVLRQRMVTAGLTPYPSRYWYDAGDTVVSGAVPAGDTTTIEGSYGMYAYYDSDGGPFKLNDPVWLVNPSSPTPNYYHGETVVYPFGSIQPPIGSRGTTEGLCSKNINGHPFIWYDNQRSDFHSDFYSFYVQLNQLFPYYASGTNDQFNPYGERLCLGSALNGLSPPNTLSFPNDSLTITEPYQGVFNITDTANALRDELSAGDCISLNGSWYPVSSWTSSSINIQGYYIGPTGTNLALAVRNWTRVPGFDDTGTGASFSYERGAPHQGDVIFRQQFAELHAVLSNMNSLAPLYGIQRFNEATSSRYLTVAAEVINAYKSVFPNADIPLVSQIVNAKVADPGAIVQSGLIGQLDGLVYSLAGSIYVRGNGGPGSNGWATDSGGRPITFTDPDILKSLLPFIPNSDDTFNPPITVRRAGEWSRGAFGEPLNYGSAIRDEHLGEIERFVQVMTGVLASAHPRGASDQDLFVKPPGREVRSTQVGDKIGKGTNLGDVPTSVPPQGWPDNQAVLAALTEDPGAQASLGHLTLTMKSNESMYETPLHLVAMGEKVELVLPSGANTSGYNVSDMLLGPGGGGYSSSTWGWGQAILLFQCSPGDVQDLLTGKMQPYPGVNNGNSQTNFNLGAYEGFEPAPTPHLEFQWVVSAAKDSTGIETDHFSDDVRANVPIPDVFGRVLRVTGLSYQPDFGNLQFKGVLPGGGKWLSVQMMPDPATYPFPLTTEIDYRNVQPDTNTDGVLNVPAGLDSFGNDTGVIAFGAERGVGQSYIPIFTTDTETLPLHAYVQQGAFVDGAGDGKSLATDVQPPGLALLKGSAAVDGLPYFYSLDTYVRRNVLINDSVNHVKRMEVIRPGGNAVVFDFPWDPATNAFKAIGTPTGWNGRDSRRTYVLRDLNPLTPGNMKYALEFADGTVQTFDTTLKSVSDASGLTMAVSSGLQPVTGSENLTDATDSTRYSVTINRSGGKITSVDYATKPAGSSSQTIHTDVAYDTTNSNLITALTKTAGGSAMPEYTYTLAGDTITTGTGATVRRTGPAVTNVAGTQVTIRVTPGDGDPAALAGTYVEDTYTFNADGLMTSDVRTLAPDSTALTVVSYSYYTGARAPNGSAPWGRVRLVRPGSGPWTGYLYYDGTNGLANTGWVREVVTPFMNGTPGTSPLVLSRNNERRFTYDDSVSAAWGQGQDPMSLVERPRSEKDYVKGTFVGGALMSYAGTTVVTRKIQGENDGWSAGVFETVSTSSKYTDSTVTGLGVKASTTTSVPGTDGQTTVTSGQSFGGNPLSNNVVKETAWGGVASSDDSGIGSVHVVDTGSPDAYGRSLSDTVSGGAHPGAHYDPAVSWIGPDSVTESDGSVTKYTYSSMGRVATKIIYWGTNHAVRYNWKYDAAGNVASVTTTAVDTSVDPAGVARGGLPVVKNTYSYDALNRLTRETDNDGGTDVTATRTTEYFYDDEIGVVSTTDILYPDGSEELVSRNTDGSLASDQGTAVTSSVGNEGVVTTGSTDAAGNVISAGSTWTSITTDGAQNTTTTYRNTLGQAYLVQKTRPGSGSFSVQPVADAYTSFDPNGRPIKYVDFDGTTTYSSYDPRTGQLASQFIDMNGDGLYTPGVDRKSNSKVDSTIPAAGAVASSETQDLANTGVTDEVDSAQLIDSGSNAGSDVSQTVNGLKTRRQTTAGAAGGWTSTTTNPDGTRAIDTYGDGLLVDEKVMPVSGTAITQTTYAYDGLRRLISKTDFRGVTTYGYFEDGTQKSVQEPGHNAVLVDYVDQKNDATTQSHRADGGQVNTPRNLQGQTSVQTGAGVLPAGFTYDTANTGQLTRLTTYQSASVSGSTISGAGATTQWGYDPASGLLTSKTFADGSRDQYQYNGKFQLANVIEPGLIGSSFAYDNGGQLISKTLTDAVTGKVSMQVGHLDGSAKWVSGYDEMGRAKAVADTDNGHAYTTTFTVDALQRPVKTVFGSAGNASVNYDYAATSGFAATESAAALRTMTLKAGDQSTVLAGTAYTYETDGKRLKTISVNGVTFTFNYFSGSNQVQSVVALPSGGGSGVTTTYLRDTSDLARLTRVGVSGAQGSVFTDTVDSYNQQDQINSRTVNRRDANDDGTLANAVATANGYTYDPSRGDALTNVSVTVNGAAAAGYGYAYDQVGNFTGNASLGSANSLNQYAALTYNGRGDVTDDGTYAYGYDANNRLITVTPHDTTKTQLRYGYDSQGRRLWKTAYAYAGGTWAPSYTRHYLWDGNNLVAELDGDNAILTGYTWGPTGLLAVTDYSGAGPVPYVVGQDLSGNVAALFDAVTGLPVASFKYDPYGNPAGASGPKKSLGLFRGKGLLVDPETPDIQHALMRDARGSEWLERDPAGEVQGGLNLHQMYGGDPVNKSDPSGLSARFSYKKQVSVGMDGSRSAVYGIYQTYERWVPPITGSVLAPPQLYSETEVVGTFQHTVSGSDAMEREAAFDQFISGKLSILQDVENADARVAGLQTLFSLVPLFGVIDHVTQGRFDEFDAVETVLTVVPAGAAVAPEAGALLRGARLASAEGEIAARALASTRFGGVGATTAHSTGAVVTATGAFEPGLMAGAQVGLIDVTKGVAAEAEGFIGPTIGRSEYRTIGEFRDAVVQRYQRFYDMAYERVQARVAGGTVASDPVIIGARTDAIARAATRRWLLHGEGIQEGPGNIISVNRWLRDPTSAGYRIPDVRIPGARITLDGTIGLKSATTPQIVDFRGYSGGDNIIIVRPNKLGGSYGIVFP